MRWNWFEAVGGGVRELLNLPWMSSDLTEEWRRVQLCYCALRKYCFGIKAFHVFLLNYLRELKAKTDRKFLYVILLLENAFELN